MPRVDPDCCCTHTLKRVDAGRAIQYAAWQPTARARGTRRVAGAAVHWQPPSLLVRAPAPLLPMRHSALVTAALCCSVAAEAQARVAPARNPHWQPLWEDQGSYDVRL